MDATGQAGVEEVDSVAAAASWSFVRSFGNIWGVAIPGAVLNIYSSQYAAELIADTTAKVSLQNGHAELRKTLQTEFGLEEMEKSAQSVNA